MTIHSPPHRNKARGNEFKRSVASCLRQAGHRDAQPTTPTTIGEHLRSPGDIGGVPFVLAVRTAQRLDLAAVLDEASNTAYFLGLPWYAAVLSRRGRPVEDAYVVLDLATFSKVLHQVPRDPCDE